VRTVWLGLFGFSKWLQSERSKRVNDKMARRRIQDRRAERLQGGVAYDRGDWVELGSD